MGTDRIGGPPSESQPASVDLIRMLQKPWKSRSRKLLIHLDV